MRFVSLNLPRKPEILILSVYVSSSYRGNNRQQFYRVAHPRRLEPIFNGKYYAIIFYSHLEVSDSKMNDKMKMSSSKFECFLFFFFFFFVVFESCDRATKREFRRTKISFSSLKSSLVFKIYA